MLSYWQRAGQWAKNETKPWTVLKAIPSVLVLVGQLLLNLQPTQRILQIAVTTIVAYAVTYVAHYLWNLLIKAPAALDAELQKRMEEAKSALAALTSTDPLEAQKREQVRVWLAKVSDVAKGRFREYLTCGSGFQNWNIHAPGIEEAYNFGVRMGLIHSDSFTKISRINPDLKSALDFVLREQGF